MQTVNVEIPAELASAAGFDPRNLSAEATRLLALELYREDKVSLGRAAELSQMPVEQFWPSATFRFITAPTNWMKIAGLWNGLACERCFQLLAADCPRPNWSAQASRCLLN